MDLQESLQLPSGGKICKCSQDTALRDIKDLIKKGILQKEASGGRSTNYELIQMPGGNRVDG